MRRTSRGSGRPRICAPRYLRTAGPWAPELRPLGAPHCSAGASPWALSLGVAKTAVPPPFPLQAVCREAALAALEESLQAQRVGSAHFEAALRTVRPRTDAATLRFYQNYERCTHGGGATQASEAPAVAAKSDRTPFAFGPVH